MNHNNKIFLYLYSLPHPVRVVKSSKMRWTANVAVMGEKRNT